MGDSTNDQINHWSLNGFGEPVFTGGLYSPNEIRTLETTIKDYCASRQVTPIELCGENHNKAVRGAWTEIAQCLPHRTVLSVYRRALRMFSGHTTGSWTENEIASLSRLVELHGHKWKTIQNKLGRSAHNCRSKFLELNDEFEKGKWSAQRLELLLKSVREVLDVPRDDMDVREINEWTLETNAKIPWTIVSFRVMRGRSDCYYKWRQMTRRSNKIAANMGLDYVPMARHTYKFDVKAEYYRWKAEQNPKWRQRYAEMCVMPLLRGNSDEKESQIERDDSLLTYIIESKANRPSEVSWHSIRALPSGISPRERFDELVDDYASNDSFDLPLHELAKVVRGKYIAFVNSGNDPNNTVKNSSSCSALHANVNSNAKEKPTKTLKPSSNVNIPGVDTDKIRRTIKGIIATTDIDEITVRGVRKILEKKLGILLSKYRREVKELIVEML